MIRKGRQAKGIKNGATKLNADKVREMRSRKSKGETYNSIARDFNVSENTAYSAINGITWKHVDLLGE